MRKIFFIALLYFFTNISNIYPQGFDWQFSSRLPTKYPYLFLGITLDKSIYLHSGNFSFFEELTECCKFESNANNGFRFGIAGEYWISGNSSLFAWLTYSTIPGNFASLTSYPLNPDTSLITEFTFDTKINSLNLITGYKQKIVNTHFFIGAFLDFTLNLGGSYEFYEKVISPTNFYFNTNPPSKIRKITSGSIANYNLIIINPAVNIGYDLDLGNSMYCSLSFNFAHSLNNVLNNDNWRYSHLSIKATIYKGIAYK